MQTQAAINVQKVHNKQGFTVWRKISPHEFAEKDLCNARAECDECMSFMDIKNRTKDICINGDDESVKTSTFSEIAKNK